MCISCKSTTVAKPAYGTPKATTKVTFGKKAAFGTPKIVRAR